MYTALILSDENIARNRPPKKKWNLFVAKVIVSDFGHVFEGVGRLGKAVELHSSASVQWCVSTVVRQYSSASVSCTVVHQYGRSSHKYVSWLIQMCDMTHSNVWHDSFKCATWLIQMCDMTHSNVWHDAFKYVSCAVSQIRLVYCLFFHLHVTFGTCTSLLALCKTLVVSAKPLSYTVLRQPSFSSHKYAFFLVSLSDKQVCFLVNTSLCLQTGLFSHVRVSLLTYDSLFCRVQVSFLAYMSLLDLSRSGTNMSLFS